MAREGDNCQDHCLNTQKRLTPKGDTAAIMSIRKTTSPCTKHQHGNELSERIDSCVSCLVIDGINQQRHRSELQPRAYIR
jgi:hypothetical protein